MNDKYQCLNIDEIFWKNRLFIDFSLNLILNINLQVEIKSKNFPYPNCHNHQFIVEIYTNKATVSSSGFLCRNCHIQENNFVRHNLCFELLTLKVVTNIVFIVT